LHKIRKSLLIFGVKSSYIPNSPAACGRDSDRKSGP
jgi:hypothetical protein